MLLSIAHEPNDVELFGMCAALDTNTTTLSQGCPFQLAPADTTSKDAKGRYRLHGCTDILRGSLPQGDRTGEDIYISSTIVSILPVKRDGGTRRYQQPSDPRSTSLPMEAMRITPHDDNKAIALTWRFHGTTGSEGSHLETTRTPAKAAVTHILRTQFK